MKIHLFINSDNRITGYHIKHVAGAVEHDATELDLERLQNNDGYLFYINKRIEYQADKKVMDETRLSLQNELHEIVSWFAQNDWIPNKVVVGEWEPSDQRFINYKAERLIKRTRQDEIIGLLE